MSRFQTRADRIATANRMAAELLEDEVPDRPDPPAQDARFCPDCREPMPVDRTTGQRTCPLCGFGEPFGRDE